MQIKVKVHGILLFTIRYIHTYIYIYIYMYSRGVCNVLCIFAYLTRHYMKWFCFYAIASLARTSSLAGTAWIKVEQDISAL